jgi:hypothetical protein
VGWLCKFDDVTNLYYHSEITRVKVNFVDAGFDAKAFFHIHLTGGRSALPVEYHGSLTKYPGPDPVRHAEAIRQVYQCIAEKTFQKRIDAYASEISRNGYFQYFDYKIYSNGDIEVQGRVFPRKEIKFYKAERGLLFDLPEKIKNHKKRFWEIFTDSEIQQIHLAFRRDTDCMLAIIPQIYEWVRVV